MTERKCKNCLLFNNKENVCAVTVLVNGEHYELPVHPEDYCHWETIDQEIQEELKDAAHKAPEPTFRAKLESQLDTPIEIKQIRAWSDGTNGYIESPAN